MQKTFADLEYDHKKRKTRREQFLERMDALIPWRALESEIAPFYPNSGKGRQPYPLRVMLRVHCVQLFYNLSDPDGCQDRCRLSHAIAREMDCSADIASTSARSGLSDGCQRSCRMSHAIAREMGCRLAAASTSARSGLRVTVSMTLQFLVRPLQRRGFAARAAP